MNKIIICLMAALIFTGAQAQDKKLNKKERKQLAAMVMKGKDRVPRPELMQDDKTCLDWAMDLKRKDPAEVDKMWGEAVMRQKQNEYIKEHIGSAIKDSALIAQTLKEIDRESMRFHYFNMEYQDFLDNQAAERRTMPKGQLVSLSYRRNGRAENLYSPIIVKKIDADVQLTYGQKEEIIYYDLGILDELRNIFERERLYQLHPSYQIKGCPLPDATIHADIFDGERWAMTAKFDDGTTISSSGIYIPDLKVTALEKFLSEMIKIATSDREKDK